MINQYKYQDTRFAINTIACDDGTMIFTVQNFPLSTTFYLTQEDAERLYDQLGKTIDAIACKEAA